MSAVQEVEEVAAALYLSVGMLRRRLRQMPAEGGLSLPESSALRRLERDGPSTVTALARAEQISVQSMGATLGALEARGLIKRESDPADGRRAVMSVTEAGLAALSDKRNSRIAQLAGALATGFTPAELDQLKTVAPLIERLAETI